MTQGSWGIWRGGCGLSCSTWIYKELTGWRVIVPLSVASLLTGLVQSLGTPWGLFRHYWVLAKLLIASLATVVLLMHMQLISYMARVTAERVFAVGELRQLRLQLLADAGGALLVLLTATALSVYKPRGLTRYGWRVQREQRSTSGRT